MTHEHPAHSGTPSQAAPQSPSTPDLDSLPFIYSVMLGVKYELSGGAVVGASMDIGVSRRSLGTDMIRDQFTGLEHLYPPILTLQQAAQLTGLKEQTLRKHLSEGKYAKCAKRGHPVRLMRDLFVAEFMEDAKF